MSAVNNNISKLYTFRDPSHFELIGLMSAIFVIFVQITMLLKSFKFRYWCEPIRMQSDRYEQFVLKLRCDYRYHLLSIISCEDQQPTTGPNHDHVTDSNITLPISTSNSARKKWKSTHNSYCNCRK